MKTKQKDKREKNSLNNEHMEIRIKEKKDKRINNL